jgi:hypothetical protein
MLTYGFARKAVFEQYFQCAHGEILAAAWRISRAGMIDHRQFRDEANAATMVLHEVGSVSPAVIYDASRIRPVSMPE